MKKRILTAALSVLLLFSLSITALSTNGFQNISVAYANIKILLNGQELTPTDANGDTVEPFIYNGTTYLPVRAVSEALGLDVDWDGSTNTVSLSGDTASSATSSNLDVAEIRMMYGYSEMTDMLHDEILLAAWLMSADWSYNDTIEGLQEVWGQWEDIEDICAGYDYEHSDATYDGYEQLFKFRACVAAYLSACLTYTKSPTSANEEAMDSAYESALTYYSDTNTYFGEYFVDLS